MLFNLENSPDPYPPKTNSTGGKNRQIRAERHLMRPLGRQEFLCVKIRPLSFRDARTLEQADSSRKVQGRSGERNSRY
jgi:hypothetical protein